VASGVAVVFWFFVLPQFGAAGEALDAATGIDPVLVVAAGVLAGVSFVAQAEMTRRVIRPSARPSLFDMTRIEMASAAVSHTVPGGTAAGTALGFRLLRQAGTPGAEAGFAAGVRGIGSSVVLNVMLWLALVAWIPINGYSSRYVLAAIVGVVVLGLAAVLVFALVVARERTITVIGRIVDHVPLLDSTRVAEVIDRISDEVRRLVSDRRLAALVLAWSAVHWLSQGAALWLLLRGFGWRAELLAVMVAFGVVNVLAAIPITPRGLGVVEAALIPMLVGFGAPASVATLGVISWRLLTFWAPIPLGAASYVSILVHEPEVGDDKVAVRRRASQELADARRKPA
jgi:uncharacterized protein (TIRG00374 family)